MNNQVQCIASNASILELLHPFVSFTGGELVACLAVYIVIKMGI